MVVVVVVVVWGRVLLTSGGVLTASVCPRRYWILGVTFCDIETRARPAAGMAAIYVVNIKYFKLQEITQWSHLSSSSWLA